MEVYGSQKHFSLFKVITTASSLIFSVIKGTFLTYEVETKSSGSLKLQAVRSKTLEIDPQVGVKLKSRTHPPSASLDPVWGIVIGNGLLKIRKS